MQKRTQRFATKVVRNALWDTYNDYDEDAINDDKTDASMRYSRWTLRVLAFLAYAALALSLIIVSSGKSSCFVQNTFKQEFLAKVVANPFYSSSQIYKNGPPSMYEVQRLQAAPFKQKASDIGIFPIIQLDTSSHAAFWAVEVMPSSEKDIRSGVYYYNPNNNSVVARDIPYAGGTGPVLASMALQAINGPVQAGSVMPNIGR